MSREYNKIIFMRKIFIAALVIFAVSGAVQVVSARAADENEALKQRAVLYWEARKKGDWEAVKNLVDPDTRKNIIPYLDSLKSQPSASEIISYRIKSLDIRDENAVVVSKIKIRLSHPLLGSPQLLRQILRDKWVKRDNIWYIIIVRPDLRKMMEQAAGNRERAGDKK